jgi:putative transposase
LHLVFAVKYRAAPIHKDWKERLHQYITGIIQNNNHELLQINNMPDYFHILIGMRPTQTVSALVQNVKTETTKWIKENNFCKSAFAWQEGYGCISYLKSKVPTIINYIQNQETHHAKETFLQEFKSILQSLEIEFDEQYFFKDME